MSFLSSIGNLVKKVMRQPNGTVFFETWGQSPEYGETEKLKQVLSNPAALFIFLLLPDLCSLGKYQLTKKGSTDLIEKHPILDLLNKPNPLQTKEQFLWDYFFWRLLGTANLLTDSQVLKNSGKNKLYWLSPEFIKWTKWFEDNKHTLFLSSPSIKQLDEQILEYETPKQKLPFRYKHLKQFFDISNGLQGWFKGPSRLDALHKVIKNSDNILDSKNVNSHLARKFIVAGKHDVKNTSTLPMSETEKNDIESKVLGRKSIHGLKSMVDIKRFLEDAGALEKLDKAFMNDAFIIGKMLHIPKDVIESFEQGSTYENQEKARAAVISYCVQPGADDFTKGILDLFGIEDLDLKLDFTHLPFVQTFEKDKADTLAKKAKAFKSLVDGGADKAEAAEACGLDLTTFKEEDKDNSSEEDKKLKAI